jgi:hypothetical protein
MSYGKIRANYLEHNTSGSLGSEYIIEGSAKAKVAADNGASLYTDANLNISSAVDEGTGDYKYNVTNAFIYSVASNCAAGVAAGTSAVVRIKTAESSTTIIDIECMNDAFSPLDSRHMMACFGDLA